MSSDPQIDCPMSGVPTDFLGLTFCPLHLLCAVDLICRPKKGNVITDSILEDAILPGREGNKENVNQR